MVISCNIDMCIMHVCIIYIYYNMYTSTFRGVVLCMFSGKFSRGMLIVPFNRERWLEASWTKTSWFLDFHMFDFFPSIFDPSLIHDPCSLSEACGSASKSQVGADHFAAQNTPAFERGARKFKRWGGGHHGLFLYPVDWWTNMKKHDYFNVSNSSSLLYQIVGFGVIK